MASSIITITAPRSCDSAFQNSFIAVLLSYTIKYFPLLYGCLYRQISFSGLKESQGTTSTETVMIATLVVTQLSHKQKEEIAK